jgi:hypothetical protein
MKNQKKKRKLTRKKEYCFVSLNNACNSAGGEMDFLLKNFIQDLQRRRKGSKMLQKILSILLFCQIWDLFN